MSPAARSFAELNKHITCGWTLGLENFTKGSSKGMGERCANILPFLGGAYTSLSTPYLHRRRLCEDEQCRLHKRDRCAYHRPIPHTRFSKKPRDPKPPKKRIHSVSFPSISDRRRTPPPPPNLDFERYTTRHICPNPTLFWFAPTYLASEAEATSPSSTSGRLDRAGAGC